MSDAHRVHKLKTKKADKQAISSSPMGAELFAAILHDVVVFTWKKWEPFVTKEMKQEALAMLYKTINELHRAD